MMKYLKGKQGCEPRVPRNKPGTYADAILYSYLRFN